MSRLDDAERLRSREESLSNALTIAPYAVDPGAPCLVAQTSKIATYPTAAKSYYACLPVGVLGQESEGAAATFTTGSAAFLALNLGTNVPPLGTNVIASFIGNRWVFRYDD